MIFPSTVVEASRKGELTTNGGTLEMVQLWINLPRSAKRSAPGYQGITSDQIPAVNLEGDAGIVRVIADAFGGVTGPAKTFTDIEMFGTRLRAGRSMRFEIPSGHNAAILLQSGKMGSLV